MCNSYYEKIGTKVTNITEEIPFEIPENWEWCRIGNMCNIYTGNSINQNEKIKNFTNVVDGYNYIGTKDINFDRTINYKNGIRIPYDIENFRTVEKDTTIMCIEGGSAGRKISFTSEKICFGNKLCAFSSYKANSLYIFYYLQNPSFIDSFKSNTSGIIGGVSVNTIKTLLFPLPPLAEQQRIVEQINKLEPLIAEYDKLEKEESKLTSGLQEKLKKAILQYAIQGKLVVQDPNDEPASVLLEKIKAEKEKLIKEGKIKRDKNESFIYKDPTDNCYYERVGSEVKNINDEIPFEIPNNWVWVRLRQLVDFRNNENIESNKLNENDWILDLEDIEKNTGNIIQKKLFKNCKSLSTKHKFYANEILYSKLRPYLNKVIIADSDGYCTTEIIPLNFGKYIDNRYAQIFLMSPLFVNYANKCSYGTKMPRLSSEDGNDSFFSLSPLNEQKQICEAIDKYFEIMKAL